MKTPKTFTNRDIEREADKLAKEWNNLGREKIILDACCGNRHFWLDKSHPNALFVDIRNEGPNLSRLRPNFQVRPDKVMDFRNLNLGDKSFKLVVFDPPQLFLGERSELRIKYGSLDKKTWRTDLKQGFDECWRVLEDYGVLIFKWNESQIKTKEVLKLFSQQPLFGHPSGSKSKTKWFTFMKIPEQQALAARDAEEKIRHQCPLCKGTRDRQAEICRECYDKKRKNDVPRDSFAEYKMLHVWIRKNKPLSKECQRCNSKEKLQACNISGLYLWDINDYFWGCASCNRKASINKPHRFTEALKEHHNSPYQKEYQKEYFQRRKNGKI